MPVRRVVMVSGAPGAGKSTVAVPLAAALRFPLLSKDQIKETLHDALAAGSPVDLQESRRLGGAAMELMWTLATWCPEVVLEANFRPHSQYERRRLGELDAQIVEVYCWCPPEVAARRFKLRAGRNDHHPTHVLSELSSQLLAEFDQPVEVGHVIRIDTTAALDVDALAAEVHSYLGPV